MSNPRTEEHLKGENYALKYINEICFGEVGQSTYQATIKRIQDLQNQLRCGLLQDGRPVRHGDTVYVVNRGGLVLCPKIEKPQVHEGRVVLPDPFISFSGYSVDYPNHGMNANHEQKWPLYKGYRSYNEAIEAAGKDE